jgi:hypothetical protein
MNKETVADTYNTLPPVIGTCSNCQAVIFASHPYSWCVRCSEPLPYRLNMDRRPIMYEKFKVSPFDFGRPETRPLNEH